LLNPPYRWFLFVQRTITEHNLNLKKEGREMRQFDEIELADYVCSHGFGDPTQEGVELGKKLIADGDDYATAGHEIVARGLTTESE
jgi:hypothetical protein